MKTQKRLQTIFFWTTALLLTGCGAQTHYGVATISSTPEGAEIINLKDDSNLGSTPAQVLFTSEDKDSERVTIQFVKPGYRSKITSFNINNRHESPEAAAAAAIDVSVELEKE